MVMSSAMRGRRATEPANQGKTQQLSAMRCFLARAFDGWSQGAPPGVTTPAVSAVCGSETLGEEIWGRAR